MRKIISGLRKAIRFADRQGSKGGKIRKKLAGKASSFLNKRLDRTPEGRAANFYVNLKYPGKGNGRNGMAPSYYK